MFLGRSKDRDVFYKAVSVRSSPDVRPENVFLFKSGDGYELKWVECLKVCMYASVLSNHCTHSCVLISFKEVFG